MSDNVQKYPRFVIHGCQPLTNCAQYTRGCRCFVRESLSLVPNDFIQDLGLEFEEHRLRAVFEAPNAELVGNRNPLVGNRF